MVCKRRDKEPKEPLQSEYPSPAEVYELGQRRFGGNASRLPSKALQSVLELLRDTDERQASPGVEVPGCTRTSAAVPVMG
eukprot:s3427_g2.t1